MKVTMRNERENNIIQKPERKSETKKLAIIWIPVRVVFAYGTFTINPLFNAYTLIEHLATLLQSIGGLEFKEHNFWWISKCFIFFEDSMVFREKST